MFQAIGRVPERLLATLSKFSCFFFALKQLYPLVLDLAIISSPCFSMIILTIFSNNILQIICLTWGQPRNFRIPMHFANFCYVK